MEYGVILLLLKKRLKPSYSINFGLKRMFHNGEATIQSQPHPTHQQQVRRRRTPGSPTGNAETSLALGDFEEHKPLVKIQESDSQVKQNYFRKEIFVWSVSIKQFKAKILKHFCYFRENLLQRSSWHHRNREERG